MANVNVACADYVDLTPDHPIYMCFSPDGESADKFILRYLDFWCGPPSSDGGADASTDAALD